MNVAEVIPGASYPMITDFYINSVGPAFQELVDTDPSVPILEEIKGRLYFNLSLVNKGIKQKLKIDGIDATEILGGAQIDLSLTKSLGIKSKLYLGFFVIKMFVGSLIAGIIFQTKILKKLRVKYSIDKKNISEAKEVGDLLKIYKEQTEYLRKTIRLGLKAMSYQMSSYSLYVNMSRKWLSISGNAYLSFSGKKIALVEAQEELYKISRMFIELGLKNNFVNSSLEECRNIIKKNNKIYQAYNRFINKHGHRCVRELDFSFPRWNEDDKFIILALKQYLKKEAFEERGEKREDIEKKERSLNNFKHIALMALRDKAEKAQVKREFIKSEIMFLLSLYRKLILKIGKGLKNENSIIEVDDIFYLKENELLNKKEDWLRTIVKRKKEYKENKGLNLPELIVDGDITVVERTKVESGTMIKGMGVSGVSTKGRVRIIKDISEIDKIEPGEIMVTDHTDPGWTPVFFIIGGVITNTGGMLSHAAIVAREIGLAAVVNTKKATEFLNDGDFIEMDGEKGVIKILT